MWMWSNSPGRIEPWGRGKRGAVHVVSVTLLLSLSCLYLAKGFQRGALDPDPRAEVIKQTSFTLGFLRLAGAPTETDDSVAEGDPLIDGELVHQISLDLNGVFLLGEAQPL